VRWSSISPMPQVVSSPAVFGTAAPSDRAQELDCVSRADAITCDVQFLKTKDMRAHTRDSLRALLSNYTILLLNTISWSFSTFYRFKKNHYKFVVLQVGAARASQVNFFRINMFHVDTLECSSFFFRCNARALLLV
jgi:hypothetical protein